MSDFIKHECGIALVRLRKPFAYYLEKYRTPMYAVNKMYLLMQKQHNRGQDGVGLVSVAINQAPGKRYLHRSRSIAKNPIDDIFEKLTIKANKAQVKHPKKYFKSKWVQENLPFTGEILLGHLRYGTHGKNSLAACHPFIRRSNWRSRSLAMAGNFNMTNVDELFEKLVSVGQHPKDKNDTTTVLEKVGHFLDLENDKWIRHYQSEGIDDEQEITRLTHQSIDVQNVIKRSSKDFDGGYTLAGIMGHGASFIARDPAGIRPAYYYADDEVIVVASEKPAIKTAFSHAEYADIKEITPAHALIIDPQGNYKELPFKESLPRKSCSFERIYFSRGSDPDIYRERKNLGRYVVPRILESVNYDLENTIFSYIPNTAETSFLGMLKAMEAYLIEERKKAIQESSNHLTDKELHRILTFRPRVEKLVTKDAKLRTFITEDSQRDYLVSHVYDTTYEVVRKRMDTVVVIDDSIVRGTTLEKSIISMLERLKPKKIVVVSSAPQIRYPDCYGIDMSKLGEFIAFRAMKRLLEKTGQLYKMDEVYERCKKSLRGDVQKMPNHVKELYDLFTDEEISDMIAELVKPAHVKADIHVIYQTVEDLHRACPNHLGDWYFTGNYPTAGGNRVVNQAFVNYMEGRKERAY